MIPSAILWTEAREGRTPPLRRHELLCRRSLCTHTPAFLPSNASLSLEAPVSLSRSLRYAMASLLLWLSFPCIAHAIVWRMTTTLIYTLLNNRMGGHERFFIILSLSNADEINHVHRGHLCSKPWDGQRMGLGAMKVSDLRGEEKRVDSSESKNVVQVCQLGVHRSNHQPIGAAGAVSFDSRI